MRIPSSFLYQNLTHDGDNGDDDDDDDGDDGDDDDDDVLSGNYKQNKYKLFDLVNLNQKSMVLGHADFEKHLYEVVVWNIYSKTLVW